LRASTIVMIGFAVVFGLLAVFIAQAWLNNQASMQAANYEANKKPVAMQTVVVAKQALRFGTELNASLLEEVPWPAASMPGGAFTKISDVLHGGRRVVLTTIEPNEPVLSLKITGPGERATLSALVKPGMKAVTIRVNDVEGVAGFVLPGERVDVVLTRTGEKNNAVNDVVIQNVRVLAVDQLADQRADKPAVVKAVTLEVDPTDGQKVALAATVGTLSLLLRKAGDVAGRDTRRVTTRDLMTAPAQESHFVTIGVTRPSKGERVEYTVPVEEGAAHSAALSQLPARN
jgi:pilus assembly protein CpaB